MARLMPGENEKIDNINNLVNMVLSDDQGASEEGLRSLLAIFEPMILKICRKWSVYFDDSDHRMIQWDELIRDAKYWFYHYTKFKYIVDGRATYNKFIKDHMDQRIRYIFECELKYHRKHIFPDPDKRIPIDGGNDIDPLEHVIHNYSSTYRPDIDEDIINSEHDKSVTNLVTMILYRIDNERYFNKREARILKDCIIHHKTHEDIANELGISRTRVSQIIGRTKEKLRDLMMEDPDWWNVF